MTFEVFEHTADVGLHLTAATLAQLFADAGRGVASLVIENFETIELRQIVTIDLEAEPKACSPCFDGEGDMGTADRGFASMGPAKQREIASKGGKAAHQ